MRPEQKGLGPPGKLTVTHYTLTDGGVLTLEEPDVEYQDYIVSGAALLPRGARTRYIYANTTIFVPANQKHSYIHAGESDLRIVSHTYSVPRPSHPNASMHLAELTLDTWGEPSLMTAEFHALIGAQRFKGIGVQIYDRGKHPNPEETVYFMRGTGEMSVGDKVFKVRSGSLVYVEEGEVHSITNTNEKGYPLHYFVMEYAEQDKMWSRRGFQGKI